jgi:hypothetical protein
MATEYIPRAQPCSTCGLAVTIVRIYSESVPRRNTRPVDGPIHTVSPGYLGERVDEECNLPEHYRS